MANASQVSKQMRRHMNRRTRSLVILAQENLFKDTPKDTEWAASNWIINLGSPHTHTSRSKADVSYDEARSSKQMLSGWDPFKQTPTCLIMFPTSACLMLGGAVIPLDSYKLRLTGRLQKRMQADDAE